ncbi:MAG: glycosyltransferase family protein, partial [Bryobacteraceae bacterium]
AWDGIDFFLEPGSEILVARDGAEVAHIVRELENSRARAIGEAARKRVLRDHTYDQRGALVESLLQETLQAMSVPALAVQS